MEMRKSKRPSSSAARAKAQSQLDELRARQKQIESEQIPTRKYLDALSVSARFVIDVNGDPPSIDQLRAALDVADYQNAISLEWVANQKQIEKLSYDSRYYQFTAGKSCGIVFHVHGTGDTRAEAIANAKN